LLTPMLFYLICSAGASLVSGKHIDFSALPDVAHLHEATQHEDAHEQKLRDELRSTIMGVHQNVIDNLDAPEVPHGNDPEARIKALLQAFHQHHPVTTPDEESPAATAIEALADEEAKPKAGLAGKEAEALAKIGKSLKTMVMMHVVMKPMLEKLTLVAEHAQGKAKEAAVAVLKEMAAMDMYSEKAAQMLGVIQKAAKGTPEQQMKAIKMLEVGLMMIKQGMHKHMMAMKALTPQHQPAAPKGGATGRMEAVVAEMKAKVEAEIHDPKRAHDPMVVLDAMMLKAMEKAVAKSEALEAASKEESQKHPEKAKLYAKALKVGLHKVAEELKTEMQGLKKKALVMMIMMKMMKEKKEKEAKAHEQPAEEEEAKAPADEAEGAEEAKAEEPKADEEAKAPTEEEEATEAKAPAEEEAPEEAKAPAEEEEATEAKAPAEEEAPEEAKAPAEEEALPDPEQMEGDAPADGAAKAKSLSALKGLLDTLGINQLRGSA